VTRQAQARDRDRDLVRRHPALEQAADRGTHPAQRRALVVGIEELEALAQASRDQGLASLRRHEGDQPRRREGPRERHTIVTPLAAEQRPREQLDARRLLDQVAPHQLEGARQLGRNLHEPRRQHGDLDRDPEPRTRQRLPHPRPDHRQLRAALDLHELRAVDQRRQPPPAEVSDQPRQQHPRPDAVDRAAHAQAILVGRRDPSQGREAPPREAVDAP
jgi:hypothetical protein